ncbi:MAG TPA: hypothetical protein VF592_13295 [Sphingomonas sp.]|jgi:ectoine hydroxylase-related dioxygenase (phytanoyl-CoA dioxygenase family)|uniref:hypothetical protein n=1 Tax=Sphingomonas sp. TaxID=28214 RepID=UPI002EDACB73
MSALLASGADRTDGTAASAARPPTMIARLFLACAMLLTPGAALACTLCHSDTAERVRAALFGPDLLTNAMLAFAPVPALLAAVWLVPGAHRDR